MHIARCTAGDLVKVVVSFVMETRIWIWIGKPKSEKNKGPRGKVNADQAGIRECRSLN
jgi:hypothetical protein